VSIPLNFTIGIRWMTSEKKNAQHFASYKDQGTEEDGKPKPTTTTTSDISNGNLNGQNGITLTKGALTKNLGIPIVIACLKYDLMPTLKNLKETDFDAMQQHLRKFCLNYGAPLFYVSSIQKKNTQQLMKYVTNRLYSIGGNKEKPQIRGKEPLFIPAGWDSILKISHLSDYTNNFDNNNNNNNHNSLFDAEDDRELYSQLIKSPQVEAEQREVEEVYAEDEQEVFKKYHENEFYDRSIDDSQRSDQDSKNQSPDKVKSIPKIQKPEKDATKEKPKEQSNEKMAQFFNNLKKKTTQTSKPDSN